MGRWDSKGWGLVVDPECTEFNFLPAFQAGAGFIVARINKTHDEHYPSWFKVVEQPYQYKMPVVGIYNLEVSAYHQYIPDYGYYPLTEQTVRLVDDVVYQKLVSLVKNKWMNALVVNFTSFLNQNGDPIPAAHVLGIVGSAIERIQNNIAKTNSKIKVVVPMIDERVIRNQYSDLGGIMYQQPYCFSDKIEKKGVNNISDWSNIKQYYPADQVVGYDGEPHSNPPFAFTNGWWGWRWSEFSNSNRNGFLSSDFKRPEGMGVMGAAFYNGTKEALWAELGVTPTFSGDSGSGDTGGDTGTGDTGTGGDTGGSSGDTGTTTTLDTVAIANKLRDIATKTNELADLFQ